MIRVQSACLADWLPVTVQVPYTTLDAATHRSLPAPLRGAFSERVQPLHVFGSYGLFRKMTGVGGRPEVVLQGADSLDGPWTDIEFRYKPGEVGNQPAVVIPHQPRLDWQMWMAALGDYHGNPWLTSLAYRLLTAQPEVLRSVGHVTVGGAVCFLPWSETWRCSDSFITLLSRGLALLETLIVYTH